MIDSKLASFLINKLPLSICKIIFSFINHMGMRTGDKVKILGNLKLAFGSEMNNRLLFRTAVRNIGSQIKNNVDAMILLNTENGRLIRYMKKVISVNGLAKLESYSKQNKGVILLSFHLGSFYLIPAILAIHGSKITVLSAIPSKSNELFENKIRETGKEIGDLKLRLLPASKTAVRSLINTLREKEMVFLLGDFYVGKDNGTVKINFMNQIIHAGYGAVWLHLKTGAPLVPVSIINTNGHYEVMIGDSLDIDDKLDYKEITQRIFRVFEQRIITEPDQWDRWKHFHEILCDR